MVIDFHMHPFCKEATWGDLDQIADGMWGKGTKDRKTMRRVLDVLSEKTSLSDYVTLMDRLSIKKAVIVSFNVQTAYGFTMVTNDDVANFVEKFPDRFIGFGCVDPPAPDALDQLIYATESLNLAGIKIVPPVQKFDLLDTRFDPLWEKIVDLGLPLWTHGGHQVSTVGSVAKFGHPLLVDDLALRFPDLTIIIGHMGTPWFWDAWSVVCRHEHVYLDISAHPNLYQYFPWDAFTKYNIEHKVLFASDHPLCNWNEILPAFETVPISSRFRKHVLELNAKKLLGIQ